MRLACSTLCFPEDRLEIALAKVGWAGYDAVEIVLTAPEPPPEEELRYRLRANELDLAAVRAGAAPLGTSPAAIDTLTVIGRAAALARSLDGHLLVLQAPGGPAKDLPGLAEALCLLDRALGPVAVDVCLVNTAGTLLSVPGDFQRLWAEALPERVQLALDPGQALVAGWDPVDLDLLPALPGHVYLNDAFGSRIVPPGEGTADLPELVAELRRRGYAGALCLALQNADPWAVDPLVKELRETAAEWLGAPS